MAKSKAKSKRQKAKVEPDLAVTVYGKESTRSLVINNHKWLLVAVGCVAVLVAYWWVTNSWPVVGIVNGTVITRWEMDRALYRQYGSGEIENIIADRLVRQELNRQNVKVEKKAVDEKMDEIKKKLGGDIEKEIGLTEMQLREQVELQLRVEKLFVGQATVSAEEVQNVAKSGGDPKEIEEVLKQQKLQQVVSAWVEGLRSKARVWKGI